MSGSYIELICYMSSNLWTECEGWVSQLHFPELYGEDADVVLFSLCEGCACRSGFPLAVGPPR